MQFLTDGNIIAKNLTVVFYLNPFLLAQAIETSAVHSSLLLTLMWMNSVVCCIIFQADSSTKAENSWQVFTNREVCYKESPSLPHRRPLSSSCSSTGQYWMRPFWLDCSTTRCRNFNYSVLHCFVLLYFHLPQVKLRWHLSLLAGASTRLYAYHQPN